MLENGLGRTGGRLSDPEWWQPLIQPMCSRCGKPVTVTDRRIVDGCGPTVSVMHLSCVFHRPTPLIPRGEPDPPGGWADYSSWERAGDLMAWSAAVQGGCGRARAVGDRALDEIDKLLTMLNRARRRRGIPQRYAAKSDDGDRGDRAV